MGKIKWDYIQMIISLGTSGRRSKWHVPLDEEEKAGVPYQLGYGDGELEQLHANWEKTPDVIKTKLLIPAMLRRTLQTRIDGKPVVEKDYFKDRIVDRSCEIDIEDIEEEIGERNGILAQLGFNGNGPRLHRYIIARYLAFTSKAVRDDWRAHGAKSKDWWNGFTTGDVGEFERGRVLLRKLRELKAKGKKPIVFAHYVFHQQFAAQVGGLDPT